MCVGLDGYRTRHVSCWMSVGLGGWMSVGLGG